MNIRFLTNVIFAYTCIEGLVVNILYPNTLPFIFKDIVIAIAYLVLMTDSRGGYGSLSSLGAPMMLFAAVTFMFLAFPSAVELLGRLVAVKQRLFYMPLAYLAYRYIEKPSDFLELVRLMALTSIPVCIFGIYLFFTGPGGLAALGANYSAIINSTAGSHGITFWRVPSTFTSPGNFGMFLMVHGIIFVSLLFDRSLDRKLRRLIVISLVMVVSALMVSGSRSPVLALVGAVLTLMLATGRVGAFGGWVFGAYAVFMVAFSYFGAGVEDRIGSIASWEHVERFRDTYFGQLFLPMLLQQPMGFGLGRATIGSRHFTDWNNVMLVESYYGVIVAEMGFLGLAVFGYLTAAITVAMLKCRRVMLRSRLMSSWLACAQVVAVAVFLLPISTPLDAAPGNLYFWFSLGAAFRLYDLEMQARAQYGVAETAPVAYRPPAPSMQ